MFVKLPKGFRVAGVHCGIKRNPAKEDLTLIVSDHPATAAGVYTQNIVFAASVGRNRQITPTTDARVIVANSGNANTCTGQQGEHDNDEMALVAATVCGAEPRQSLVMSTGIIGEFLPMEKITAGIRSAAEKLGNDENSVLAAARGILTTDKSHKLVGRASSLSGGEVQTTGFAKGAGMIGPRMATMLAVVMTDAGLSANDAQSVLRDAVDESFNCISVEGHMSTSDTVLLLASGAATAGPLSGNDLNCFRSTLTELCIELARMIPDDGEGASHLINIEVQGCATRNDAHQIASTIANSTLVKTGIAGCDPNWGRIVSAAGYSGVSFDPSRLTLTLNGALLYKDGAPVEFDDNALSASIREQRETFIALRLSEGNHRCRFWTSDLTVDYVRFNSDYHT